MTSELASSLWHKTCQATAASSVLTGEVTADMVVIGGGYTAALRAAELGASVHLIEALSFCSGGSGRNVGLVNAGLWLPPQEINTRLGKPAGDALSASCWTPLAAPFTTTGSYANSAKCFLHWQGNPSKACGLAASP